MPLCVIQGVCLHACSVNPSDNMVYCKQLDPVDGVRQFVRVDCPLDTSHMPPALVTGQLCFFGDTNEGRAASFDVDTGDLYSQEGSDERRLTTAAIQGFEGSTSPRLGDTQVQDAQTTVLRDGPGLEGYIVTRLDWGLFKEEVLAGCEFDWDSEVP